MLSRLRAWLRLALCKFWWTLQQKVLRLFLVMGPSSEPSAVTLVAGADISFVKGSTTDACAALVVCKLPSLAVVYGHCQAVRMQQPYIPGFLAFREVQHILDLLRELRTHRPECMPDVILVDGNGILHPAGFGIACHLGVLSGIPCVGVGKSLHCIDGLTNDGVRRLARRECLSVGDSAALRGASGKVWGAVLRTTAGGDDEGDAHFKPLIVSVGYRLSLQRAVQVVRACCKHRVPEPVRQADLRSRAWLRMHPPQSTWLDRARDQ